MSDCDIFLQNAAGFIFYTIFVGAFTLHKCPTELRRIVCGNKHYILGPTLGKQNRFFNELRSMGYNIVLYEWMGSRPLLQ